MIQVAPNKVYFYYTEKHQPGFDLPREELLPYLQAQFSEFPPVYAEVIAKAKPAEIFHDDLYDLKPLRKWHHDRVLLLGDAAHAKNFRRRDSFDRREHFRRANGSTACR